MKKVNLIFFLLLLRFTSFGQFQTNGSATDITPPLTWPRTYQMTQLFPCSHQVGTIWNNTGTLLDFNLPFTLDFEASFSNTPSGADGIVAVFKTDPAINTWSSAHSGGLMGYYDMTAPTVYNNSLAVEFDIFHNDPPFTDPGTTFGPSQDHVMLARDGDFAPVGTPAFPATGIIGGGNVKDGIFRNYRIRWTPPQRIEVFVNGISVLQKNICPSEVFDSHAGASSVTWGFTSATGSSCSEQIIRNVSLSRPTRTLCVGGTVSLFNMTPGGIWTTSGSVATINAGAGTITGNSIGTQDLTYTMPGGGCFSVITMEVTGPPTVNPLTVCVDGVVNATATPAGGTWSSTNGTGSLIIDPTFGSALGVTPGTATITYTIPGGCSATATATIISNLEPIVGEILLCGRQLGTAYTDLTPGGTWSSSNPSMPIDPTGVLTAFAYPLPATTTITYALSASCKVTKVVTQDEQPMPIIEGCPKDLCVGTSVTLTGYPGTSGSYTSSWTNTGTGGVTFTPVLPSSVIVTAVPPAGAVTVVYEVVSAAGCKGQAICSFKTKASPTITGPTEVCQGNSITLTGIAPGGAWNSGNTSIATVDPSGVVTGVSGGTVIISYGFPGGCVATYMVTVIGKATACVTWGWSTTCSCWAFTFTGTPGATVEYEVTDEHLGYGIPTMTLASFTFPTGSTTLEMPYTSLPGNTVKVCVLNIKVGDCKWVCDCPSGDCCAHVNMPKQPNTQPELETVSQIAPTSSLQIQPNPNTGTFKLSGQLQVTNLKEVTIEVVDILGKTLLTKKASVKNGSIEENIALHEVANGVYMVKIKGDNVSHVLRCVIDK